MQLVRLSLLELRMGLSGKSWVVLAVISLFLANPAAAQNFRRPVNSTVQLPVVRVFNVRTAVGVPDGGTMSLGGVSRYSSGQSSRGIPGLRGPLFQNRAGGFSAGGNHASVTATIISNREIEEDLMAEGQRLAALRALGDPNGSRAVQAKADFITRNIGRTRNR